MTEEFVGQFVASPDDINIRGWTKYQDFGWSLYTHPVVRVIDLPENGWLIGQPTFEGRLVKDEFEGDLYDLGGPWIAILPDEKRVYMDSFAHQSIVFGHQHIATNPLLIPGIERDRELNELFRIEHYARKFETSIWYPFGLTPFKDVRRLMPNHYIDLENWEAKRHWPTSRPASSLSLDEAATIVSGTVKNNVHALYNNYSLYAGLSAGLDTRMILACIRSFAEDVHFVTHNVHPYTGPLDLRTAKKLASKFGLPHAQLSVTGKTEQDVQKRLRKIGYARADNTKYSVSSPISNPESIRITGLGGEILRGNYYNNDEPDTLSAQQLLERLKLPANEQVVSNANKWLAGIPFDDPTLILDLLHVEQRIGCWDGPQNYAGDMPHRKFMALCHRDLLEVMIALPREAKKSSAVHYRIIQNEWPELLDIPVNRDWGVKVEMRKMIIRATEKVGVKSILGIKSMLRDLLH